MNKKEIFSEIYGCYMIIKNLDKPTFGGNVNDYHNIVTLQRRINYILKELAQDLDIKYEDL